MKPYQLDEVLEKISRAIKNNDGKTAADISSAHGPASFARTSKNLA